MLYLYYNARHKAWSKISRFSYDLKRRSFKTEMNEGDKVLAIQPSLKNVKVAA